MASHVLFESASGYAVFEVKLRAELEALTKAVQESVTDQSKFQKMVSLVSFAPFKSAANALENINDVSEGWFSFRVSFEPHRARAEMKEQLLGEQAAWRILQCIY